MSAPDRETCRRLRSKGMYVQAPHDPDVPPADSGHFWCSRTMSCLGPDRGVVEPSECRAQRRCFEER